MPWVCYLIINGEGRTYIGITNNIERRLKQHNGILKGGAKSTRGKGPWKLYLYIKGFPNRSIASKFEWRMHHPGGHRSSRTKGGLSNRLEELEFVLKLPNFTSTCTPTDQLKLEIIHAKI